MEITEVKVFDTLSPELKTVVKKLDEEAFRENYLSHTSEQIEEMKDKYSSEKDVIKHLLAFQNNEIIGGITLSKRTINFGGKNIILGGIGSVWTRKDKRRIGVSSILLKKGMEILLEEKCVIDYLCTNINKLGKLYGKFGFQPLNKQYTFLAKSGKRYYEEDGMIAPVASHEVFEQVMKENKPFDIGQGNW